MDDDLDFSNDSFLLKIQQHKQNIGIRLNECRDGMQATVDQISYIESSREIERIRIEKEFEKAKLQILYLLDKRRKGLLLDLDRAIDVKREALLDRVQTYQQMIVEA